MTARSPIASANAPPADTRCPEEAEVVVAADPLAEVVVILELVPVVDIRDELLLPPDDEVVIAALLVAPVSSPPAVAKYPAGALPLLT